MKTQTNLSRREFLKAGAILGGGLIIPFSIPARASKLLVSSTLARLNAFLRIAEDNIIHIIISKVEMGQGISTTLPMLIAEELDCDWEKIRVEYRVQAKAGQEKEGIFQLSTGGSDTTKSEFDRYRMAGATARMMLVAAAAKRLGVQSESCSTKDGFVISGNKRLSYGEVATDASLLPLPSVSLRDPSQWKFIGRSKKRLDSREKTNGTAKYGMDIQFPGLLTAVMCYPPVFGGKVKSFDATKTKAIAGVRDIVQIPTGIAVIADNFWAAKQGREAMEIIWDFGDNEKMNSELQIEAYRELALTPGKISQQKGNAAAAIKNTTGVFEAEYIFPYLSHSPMEPLNCTVKIDTDNCEVWVGTQDPALKQEAIAKFLGMKTEQVTLHTPYLGGSFGRRGTFYPDWIIDAVQIARISGRFIKLVWSREDDIKGGYYRPFFMHKVNIAVGTGGLPAVWQHKIVGQSIFTNTILEEYIVKDGIDYASVDGVNGSPYLENIADHSVELHSPTYQVPVLSWRSVGNTHTAFVMETLVDELAFKAQQDPLEYRRLLLKHRPKHLAVLELAAEKAGWNTSTDPGRFRGFAIHAAMGSIVAQIIELSVIDKKIKLHRVVCAVDCGLAVNPDGVIAQMEGGIVFGLTAALYGEITIENGRVQQSNFYDYRMLRMNEAPDIEIHILQSTSKMGGAGEPGVPPIAPALANALFAATGKRIRRLPVKLDI